MALLLSCGLLVTGSCLGAQNPSQIAPEAERIFRAASQYLAEAPQFSLSAEIWREHVTDFGPKVQFSQSVEMEIRRPGRLHATIQSSHGQRGFWYDGKSLTVLDGKRNLFSATAMPGTLDETLDVAHDQFGIDLPLMDLALSDPYKSGMSKVQGARYYGIAPAMGFECHHLAFTQDNIDWQVWIQTGPQPLIRKFIITHKNEPGAPEFTALIRSWDFVSRIADADFVFEPPRGASKIEMRKDAIAAHSDGGSVSSPKAQP